MPYRNPNQIWSTIQLQGVPNKNPYRAMCWLSRYKWRWSALTISTFNKSATMNGAANDSRLIQSMSITACLPSTRLTDSLCRQLPGSRETGKVRTPFSLELIRDLRCLGHVFAGHKQELISRSFCTTEPIGPVFIRFVKGHCGIFGHPLDDQKNPRNLAFAFELFDFGGAGQVPAAPLLNKLGYVLDVCRHPTLISYLNFSHSVILHQLAP